jgi:transcriptional regulator with XRE-family HTH domain
MTGQQFLDARTKLGLTQRAMAGALRLGSHGWQTISGWENGHKPVPGPVQLAVEHLLAAVPSDAPPGLEEAMQRLASPKAFVPRTSPIWEGPEAQEIWARIDYARKALTA